MKKPFFEFYKLMAETQQPGKYHYTKNIIAQVAGILILIPLTPFICRFIPPVIIGGFNIDLILSFLIALLLQVPLNQK